MKKLVFLVFVALSFQGFAQEKHILEKPKVDARVELLSIVFRLAGNEEYNSTQFKFYTDRIENHFSSYKNHELIQFVKKMKNENSVSYDAVMSMAIHIDNNLNPLTDFTENIPDTRWGKNNANEFVNLLKKFYQDAECDVFFKNNEDLYKEISAKFLPVYENLDLNWYSSFYGKEPTEKFTIVIGLGNGSNSYGPSYNNSNGKKEVYAIIGTLRVDSLGMAEFKINEYFPTLLHEFNHSFVNYLLEKNKEAFRNSGEKIYEAVKYEMNNQAYGNWEIMLNEALVRASVIKYFKDHNFDKSEIDKKINEESNNGFLWIKGLVAELENYDAHREIYPTLESYMPKLVEAYGTYAEKIIQFDAKRPKVESIKELKNGDANVDATIKTITVNFDRPLSGKGYSVFLGKKGKQAFPVVKKIYYSDDNKSVIMEVQLETDKEYQFVLTGNSFKTPEGIGLKSYEVNFKTTK
ncbi:DUF4932 domain-containing protein [Parabacteroides sp. Marseille-P3160]|uniref:DUF4932 domain-containing protein n=1 Tax=Parabacteroides sp. Marseille-P3160 TaxID=1917887 RepID=UPI0009BBDDEA|nr:DUF4932 domain-containing protein [Parabacteroides sp. Marseille-P3160]